MINFQSSRIYNSITTQTNPTNVSIITPVKNEQENLPRLISSVENQSLQPLDWIIINDSSTDRSPEIIDSATEKNDWITRLDHESRGYDVGEKVSRLINEGYKWIKSNSVENPDYYMVLDGDMRISKNYIEKISQFLSKNEEYVIASGGIYTKKHGEMILENRFSNQPAGGATLFDSSFIHEIGGFPTVPGWDSASKAKARLRGYNCKYLSDYNIRAVQSRPTGGKGNTFKAAMMRGSINYQQNHHPLVIFLRGSKMAISSPYYPAIPYLIGYIISFIIRDEKIRDEELRDYYWNRRPQELMERFVPI